MRPGDRYDCLYCLSAESFTLKVDKKGRPFFMCSACGSRTFVHGNGLLGPQRLWGKLSLAMQAGEDDVARELIRREVANATQPDSDIQPGMR